MADPPHSSVGTATNHAGDERGLIRSQMWVGAGLIAFGALSITLFQLTGVLDGQAATAAFGVATAVVGAGAAMLPTGAAAGASARILRSLPDQDVGVDGHKPGGLGPGSQKQNGETSAASSATSTTARTRP